MGNCCKGGSSSMVCAGDDWSDSLSLEDGPVGIEKAAPSQESRASFSKKRDFSPSSSSSSSSTITVKIKMTKKELEKLLKEVDTSRASLEQVMARLIGGSDDYSFMNNSHHQPWRPSLQSIPEVN
ncbi:uncharacterized protein LOC116204265 [Punica granatum]|uniref:Uncharacterized protein LOC116204265 n=2 Tax=Punica granatum TaxID=22663 RepID=A0A6P8DCH8_PUNGR|nr:uncharacterized protein LOC116204265 [Punica granatum]PKI72300.1 hypothetical protein CRG98_007280 [Punica granatum]